MLYHATLASNIESTLSLNQWGLSAVDDMNLGQIIIDNENSQSLSKGSEFILKEYTLRNNPSILPSWISVISSISVLINRSEKWGIFLSKYNPDFQEFFVGTGPLQFNKYFFDHNKNNIEGGWEGEGNIDADPQFTDPENGDFTLQFTSPCIDAGDPNSPLDPDGTRADIGAYPFFQIPGCIDSLAINFDEEANINDGSCEYPDNGDYSLSFDGVDDWVELTEIELLENYTLTMNLMLNDNNGYGNLFNKFPSYALIHSNGGYIYAHPKSGEICASNFALDRLVLRSVRSKIMTKIIFTAAKGGWLRSM